METIALEEGARPFVWGEERIADAASGANVASRGNHKICWGPNLVRIILPALRWSVSSEDKVRGLSEVARELIGEGGRFLLSVPWCLAGCGAATTDTLAHISASSADGAIIRSNPLNRLRRDARCRWHQVPPDPVLGLTLVLLFLPLGLSLAGSRLRPLGRQRKSRPSKSVVVSGI